MSSSTLSTSSDLPNRPRSGDFLAPIYNFFYGIAQNPKVFVTSIIAIIAVSAGTMWVMGKKDAKSELAKNALFQAQKTLEKELQAIAAAEPAAPVEKKAKKDEKAPPKPAVPDIQSVAFKKFDVDAKLGETVGLLKKVVQDFDGTRSAFDARLALGDLYYSHGEPVKATPWYEQASRSAPSGFEKALALSSWGYSLESSGKSAEAISVYEKAINLGEVGLKGDLLLAVARSYETLKDVAKAKATYEQIIAQMPDTEYAKKAELFKSQLD